MASRVSAVSLSSMVSQMICCVGLVFSDLVWMTLRIIMCTPWCSYSSISVSLVVCCCCRYNTTTLHFWGFHPKICNIFICFRLLVVFPLPPITSSVIPGVLGPVDNSALSKYIHSYCRLCLYSCWRPLLQKTLFAQLLTSLVVQFLPNSLTLCLLGKNWSL